MYKKKINYIILKNKINKIHFIKNIDNYSYEQLQQIIINKKNIILVSVFLEYIINNYSLYLYNNNHFINSNIIEITKKFMACFLLYKCDNDIIINKTEYNDNLKDLVKKININLVNINKTADLCTIMKLVNNINDYINIYNKWSRLDKRINTYIGLHMYYRNKISLLEMGNNSNSNNSNSNNSNSNNSNSNSNIADLLVSNINSEQLNIEKNIEYMNDNIELALFRREKDNIDYYKNIDIELYWIDIRYRLSKTNPDKLVLVELLDKTKILIKNCIPNRIDLHNDIDTNIDIDFITQFMENDIIDHNFFNNTIKFIFDYIEKLQCPSEDKKLENLKKKCLEELNNKIFYRDFIPMFFRDIFNRLETIIEGRKDFMEFTNNLTNN